VLVVEERRQPDGPERLIIPAQWVILRCANGSDQIEIAMAESTVTGFSSWLEAAPPRQPGTYSIRPRPAEQ
jgi:hypothetical protein